MSNPEGKIRKPKKENDETHKPERSFEAKSGKTSPSEASRKQPEVKKENDEPHKPEKSFEAKSEKKSPSEASRKQPEVIHSPDTDIKKKQSLPTAYEREAKTKAHPHAVAQHDKRKEREVQAKSSNTRSDGRKSPGANSKNNQQESASSEPKVKLNDSPSGNEKHKGQKTPPPAVIWRHTLAANKKIRELEKAAELERRTKAKKILDADKQTTQDTDGKLGSASDTPSPKIRITPADDKSSRSFDALPEQQKMTDDSKMSPKKAASDTDIKLKKQPDFGKKAGEKKIPSSREKSKKEGDSSRRPEEVSKAKKEKKTPDAKGKDKPKEKFPEKKLKKQKQKAESEKLKSKKEKSKKGLLSPLTDQKSLKVQTHREPSSVALTSIEKEILTRTDPDLEQAIIRSISFSFRISEPTVRPDDLAAYIQKIREEEAEEAAAEAERGPVLQESDISVALSTDSTGIKDEERRKKLSWKERLLERVDDAFSASVKSKHCLEIFRCASAIQKEKKRQRLVNRFIIHPYSQFRIGWDIMVVIALILTMVALPVEIAFFSAEAEEPQEGPSHEGEGPATGGENGTKVEGVAHEGHIYEGINLFAEAIFVIDIVLNFRTGYVFREMDQVILTNKDIVWHYLRTWFILDFISAVPFDKLYEWTAGHSRDHSHYLQIRFVRLAKILALLRAFEVFRLLRYIHSLETIFVLQANVVEICNLIGATLLFAHWNGCLQYMACFTEHYPDFPPDSWIAVDNLQWSNATTLRRYTRSAVRALSHMLAVGYGQRPPTATSETWIVLISMLVGCTFYALFIAYMFDLLRSLDYSGAQYNEEVDSLREFLRNHKISSRVQRRILRFLDQKYRHKFFDSDVYFKTSVLSPSCQESLSMHNCRRLVENVSFFKNASKDFIYAIVKRLEFQVFYPGELILHAGTKTQCLLLVAHGKLEVYSKAVLLEKIYDGGYYGEVSLLLRTAQQFDVIAADVSDIYLLTKAEFDEVLAEFGEIRDSLREIGAVHLQRHHTRIELLKQDDLNSRLE